METGENILDDYSNYIYIRMGRFLQSANLITQLNNVIELGNLSNLRKHKIVEPEDLADQSEENKRIQEDK